MVMLTTEHRTTTVCLAALTIITLTEHCLGGSTTITTELDQVLFQDYKSALIPVCDDGSQVTLHLDIALRQIIYLNEKEQVLSTNIWIRMGWKDCRLVWYGNNSFNHISTLVVGYDDVWTPDLTLYDSCADEEMMPGRTDYRAKINSTGYVQYNFPTVLKSICRVNVTYFPFDSQICLLTFGSWSYPLESLDMALVSPSGDLDVYIRNSEWHVNDLPGKRCVITYNDAHGQNYTDIRYMLTMQRRPAFYIMTMLFPCILTSAIATVGFLLPSESGEKVSLEVTVLLSLAVFLLVISDFLPPSSDTFPLIGSYFASSMVLVSLSLIMSITVLNVHYRGEIDRRMPRWARRLFLDQKLGLCCNKRKGQSLKTDCRTKCSRSRPSSSSDTDKEDVEMANTNGRLKSSAMKPSSSVQLLRAGTLPPALQHDASITSSELASVTQQVESMECIKNFALKNSKHDTICSEWQSLARILDRVFLLLYIITSLVVTLVFLLQLAVHSPELAVDPCKYGATTNN